MHSLCLRVVNKIGIGRLTVINGIICEIYSGYLITKLLSFDYYMAASLLNKAPAETYIIEISKFLALDPVSTYQLLMSARL